MQPAKKHRQSQYGVITLCVLLLICLFGPVRVFGADSQIRTEFVSLTGVTSAQISQGSPGRGVLVLRPRSSYESAVIGRAFSERARIKMSKRREYTTTQTEMDMWI